jgi:thiamine-phosphate pyrophosphorylase
VTVIADREPCRFYLTTPPELVSGGVLLRDFLPRLEAALKMVDVACLLIAAPAEARDAEIGAIAEPLIRAAQPRDVAALISGRAMLAKTLGADGVHLDLRNTGHSDAMRAYRDARKTLAEDAIVGTACPPERHLAMEVAEAGADYVGFDLAGPDATETLAWWGEVMTVPCIAFGQFDPATATALARNGADFIAPEPAVWNSVDATSVLAALQASIRAG